jgi:uncharacterized protein YicC (UPF0701 family)
LPEKPIAETPSAFVKVLTDIVVDLEKFRDQEGSTLAGLIARLDQLSRLANRASQDIAAPKSKAPPSLGGFMLA